MLKNNEFLAPSFLKLPESLQQRIIDLFISNQFVQAKKLYDEYMQQFVIEKKTAEEGDTVN